MALDNIAKVGYIIRMSKTKLKQDWHELLKKAIADSGLTYRDLGKKAGIDASVVCRLVSGERMPSFKSTEKLADSLGLELRQTKGGE
jgi:ribosome-binding protein aMBF1 (putative translation factor)